MEKIFHLSENCCQRICLKFLQMQKILITYFCWKMKHIFDLRLIVIYTGDVQSAESTFETKCLTLRTEQAFLSHIVGESVFNDIQQKVLRDEVLEDDDLMKLVILPLTMPGSEGKQIMLKKVVDLAEKIKGRINMTQIGQMYEKEKIEYGNRKAKEERVEIALKLLKRNIDMVDVMEVTGLTEEEIREN